MVTVPVFTVDPHTCPVAAFTVAMVMSLLDHAPSATVLLKVEHAPWQIDLLPVMAPGCGFTVTMPMERQVPIA